MCVFGGCWVCACDAGVLRGQKRWSDHPELELQALVIYPTWVGNQTLILCRGSIRSLTTISRSPF